ncbi:four-carbon acid sugar kinase family protein [Tissierella creatinophila]|uniref:Four-carbon acid sugar kinase family protein n=1 Tax=Tissierella creatinophila DSM 6911 TaxID=1123403 RepID=A0A1U7M2J1_TISCR|nr:four-carbon acid sugar kinase family protein [Tissierella creatinophila]OLS01511.1 hypothetical protein TICRE_25500 [Tissierella creatinophila DSM 6911]
MTKFRMIADDLTGANANCALMKKIGLDAATIFNLDRDLPQEYNAIAFTTNSRAIEPQEAYIKVKEALDKLKSNEVELYSKRIDSTLRGNIGVELNSFFDSLGEDYMGIAVPSYPATNRVVVNGIMFVNGELLLNSDAGKDTKTPVSTSNVIDIFRKGLKYNSDMICIEDIEKGVDYLSELIKTKKKEGVRLLVFDGLADKHLETIALAVLASGVKFFASDPGPFTLEVANQMLERDEVLNKVLMVVGSVTDTSIKQIKELLNSYDFSIVRVDAKFLAQKSKRDEEIKRATKEALKKLEENDYLLITTTPYKEGEKRLDLMKISKEEDMDMDDISIRIADGLAEISKNTILSEFSFAGTFISGGDITVAFSRYMESQGIEIREEVIPLSAYGRMIGGLLPDHRIISKGGMVGDRDAMKICFEKLKKE